ncbi:MAG: EamA family transporter [Neisseria sp.]|nr:EamA family transporter [Neisseria sp.]
MFYQILALLIWSSSFIAAKFAYTMLEPPMMVQLRLLISALIVLPVCRRHAGNVPREKWKPLLWLSFLNYIVVLMLQFVGLQHTSAASAETVIGLEPLLMVFIGHFFFRDRAQWYHWLCGLAAFAGVAVMIAGGRDGGGIGIWGCLLVLAGGVVFCSITRPTQRLIADIGAPAYTSLSLAAGAVLCLPFSFLLSDSYEIRWNWEGGIALLYLGVGCSWFAYWLWNQGMKTVPANLSGLMTTLEPVFGILLAVLLLGEQISLLSGLGMLIVVAAAFAAAVLSKVSWRGREA